MQKQIDIHRCRLGPAISEVIPVQGPYRFDRVGQFDALAFDGMRVQAGIAHQSGVIVKGGFNWPSSTGYGREDNCR